MNSAPNPSQRRATGDGIDQIAASVRSGQVVLFLGAGVHASKPALPGQPAPATVRGSTGGSYLIAQAAISYAPALSLPLMRHYFAISEQKGWVGRDSNPEPTP
jgi:hypothetical protein